jgi:hypothetical protein
VSYQSAQPRSRYSTPWLVVFIAAVALWLVLSFSAGGTYAAAPSDPSPGKATDLVGCWSAYAVPVVPGYSTAIADVDALSPSDVWTAGTQDTAGGGTRPRIHHWNGSAWSIVLSPTGSGSRTGVATIDALAPNDVWAAGASGSASFVLRWDGTAWVVQNTLDIGPINEISALSANDVWAISGNETMHWNGTSWTVHEFPVGFNMYGVTIQAVATNDVWAGGYVQNSVPRVLRWDGTKWNVVTVTGPYSQSSEFSDFAVIAPDDIWAVGRYNPTGSQDRTFTAHWDGTDWTTVTSPTPPGSWSVLQGVSATGPGDVWAVGITRTSPSPFATLIMHWDGSAWASVPTQASVNNDRLMAVAALSPNNVWAVGYSTVPNTFDSSPIVLRYTDPCSPPSPTPTFSPTGTWTPTSTQTGTATPVTLPYCWIAYPFAPLGSWSKLTAVSASGPNDVWAVGSYGAGGNVAYALTMHWNGNAWTQVPMPAGVNADLRDVVAIAPNDAWAVGAISSATFTMHWNGTQWSVVPSPNINNAWTWLKAVDAAGPNDVWAVGSGGNPLPGQGADSLVYQTVTMHWNGTLWTIVPSPNPGFFNYLVDVDVASANDVWAVGDHNSETPARRLTLRWNGAQWQQVGGAAGDYGNVAAVEALSPTDVWLSVIWYEGGSRHAFLHWDGAQWATLPSPTTFWPVDLDAAAPNDIWGAGNGAIVHWNGSAWGRAAFPQPPSGTTYPLSVAAIAAADAWAVGYAYDAATYSQQLAILHYSPNCTPLPTPVVTSTPTPLPPTTTPTPLPPRCPQERFTDVCPGDYFYQPVLALSDLDILRGYTSAPPCDSTAHIPCFKPYNGSTRGQIAKVVSLAAGFSEPVIDQTFEDVLPGSPFWVYIERMASRDIIQGYPCGGEFEPCGPEYKPYFRPNNPVTRGQLSKMTSEAFGFSEPVSGQTFEDVWPGSTFYEWVQRIASRDIIQGYPCGGVGELCVPPENRPYFRPNNHVTRGQTAKIVHLAMLEPTLTPTVSPSPGTTPSPTPSDLVCQGIPPSEYMEIVPGNCAPAGSNFSFTGTAFQPGEEVTAYSIDPYGQVFGGPHTLTADVSGRAGPVAFNTLPDFLTGVWNMNMVGSTSGHHARGYFKLTPP